VVVPVTLLLTVGYTAVFWNATEGVGFGARAMKSVIGSDEASDRDKSSDLYRDVENYNLVYTVRAEPLTGVGFGKPFYRPIQLADISFFVFYEYIPHNQFLWIWLKMGYFGFVALFFVIAATVRAGTRAAMRLPPGNSLAIAVGALCYVAMFFVFASADISWEPKSAVFLGLCIATCANILRLDQTGHAIDETEIEVFDELMRQSSPPSR
jgi:hypothetical protein